MSQVKLPMKFRLHTLNITKDTTTLIIFGMRGKVVNFRTAKSYSKLHQLRIDVQNITWIHVVGT